MNEPISPAWVERRLVAMIDAADELIDSMAPLMTAAADAEVRYKSAYHQALLSSDEKTVALKESDAHCKTSGLMLDWKVLDARVGAMRERARLLSEEIRAMQSLNANVRNAMERR